MHDTSALMAVLLGEPAGVACAAILTSEARLLNSAGTLAEALIGDVELTPRLTAREVEVLSNLRDGLTQRQVGSRLKVAEETVRAHLKSIRSKYMDAERDVTNTGSLVREAGRDGWI